MIETQVLVVGAGPVGLTLALDLAQRGVQVVLVEKNPAPLRLPKMERSNPRTMEIYRRLGLVDRLRAAAFPADAPMDVVVAHSLAEEPLVRLSYPSVNEARQKIADCTDGSLPREPYQLLSQYTLEPILMEEAKRTPNLTVLQSTELVGLTQDEDGVTARIKPDGEAEQEIRAEYLVGSDGGGGVVRKMIGVKYAGKAGIGSIINIFFRCDDLVEKSRAGLARHYCFAGVSAGGGAAGVIVIQDDMKHFGFHTQAPEGFDPVAVLREATGLDIHPEILHSGQWMQHLLVSEQHGVGRVFLAGDANHLYIPAGGLGMNTGIVDAINLSWKLAGTLAGWGGPALLQSYGPERSAAAHRNLEAVGWALEGVIAWRNAYTPLLQEDTPEGRAARAEFVRIADTGNRRVYEMHGADLGYRYRSAVICGDEGPPPASPLDAYIPTTWPGAHLPHMWIEPGVAVYDRLNRNGFTLLVLGDAVDTSAIEWAFAEAGAPLEVLRIDDPNIRPTIRNVYERDLLLVRPDLHVVWRSDALPDDVQRLAAIATGHEGAASSDLGALETLEV